MIEVTRDVFALAEVFTIARGSRTEAHVLSAKITRDGVSGWGECVPYARYDETPEDVADPEREIAFLCREEWALTAEDIVWRRSGLRHGFDPDRLPALRQAVARYRTPMQHRDAA